MRKIVLYIAMSLDGYIAGEDGGVDWLDGDGSDIDHPGSFDEFMETVDTIILGYKTYHQVVAQLSPGDWPYKGKKSIVVTHRQSVSSDEIIFTDRKLKDLIRELKQSNGRDIWVCGGASIVNQMMNFDLIDQFCITVVPTILGRGIRLFEEREQPLRLTFISSRSYHGMTELIYERRK